MIFRYIDDITISCRAVDSWTLEADVVEDGWLTESQCYLKTANPFQCRSHNLSTLTFCIACMRVSLGIPWFGNLQAQQKQGKFRIDLSALECDPAARCCRDSRRPRR